MGGAVLVPSRTSNETFAQGSLGAEYKGEEKRGTAPWMRLFVCALLPNTRVHFDVIKEGYPVSRIYFHLHPTDSAVCEVGPEK